MKLFDYPVPIVVVGGLLAALPVKPLTIIGLLIVVVIFIEEHYKSF